MILNKTYNFADKTWFYKNRIPLKVLCNIPLTREWFRDKLRLNPEFEKYPVVRLNQNSIHYKVDKDLIVAEIYSGNVNEWALKREFESFLRYFHKWDLRFAKYPALNLGFDTLTSYSSTSDGYIYTSNADWATVRAATSGTAAAATGATAQNPIAAQYLSSTIYIDRAFFYFDTSTIPSDNVVSSAIFSLYGAGYSESHVCCVKGTQADPYVGGDFDSFSGTEYGHSVGTWSNSNWNNITWNSTGMRDIVKGAGAVTKVCCREYDHDYLDVTCGTSAYRNGCTFADYTGTTRDPKLVIQYGAASEPSEVDVIFFGTNF